MDGLILIEALILSALALYTLSFVISSVWEREGRAALVGGVAFLIFLGTTVGLFILRAAGFFQTTAGLAILVLGLIILLPVLALFVRLGKNPRAQQGTSGYVVGDVKRFDEREQVFSRGYLAPDSEQYETFYRQHPQWKEGDDKRRKMGIPMGLPGAIDEPHQGPNLAALFASFGMPHHLGNHHAVRPEAAPFFGDTKLALDPREATERVKGLALHIGADLVGIAEINPRWVYSTRGHIKDGDWEKWGTEIELTHRYAIAFAVEMSSDMVRTAPHTPSVVESGLAYAKVAFVAAELAAFVANVGYSATANHFQHYDVLLVPMAVDAGLGEVGRLGILMTKEFGPRVRLGCVTTDLPLIPDRPVDIGVEHFCRICKKCAHCCPSGSIPFDAPKEINGSLRWKVDAESCFEYWAKIGTDCCLCMRVCPWSHPRTAPHRLITEVAARNRVARPILTNMDDLFYGKSPKPGPGPSWATYRT